MKTLIPLSDFVLEQLKIEQSTSEFKEVVRDYTKFLRQPLTLSMFVPVDVSGNILTEPFYDPANEQYWAGAQFQYETAKEKVLFSRFNIIKTYNHHWELHHGSGNTMMLNFNESRIVEDLLDENFETELTPSALKAIGVKE